LSVLKTEIDKFLIAGGDQRLRGESGRMELKNLSTMIEWWIRFDGPNGLISAPMSYGWNSPMAHWRVQRRGVAWGGVGELAVI